MTEKINNVNIVDVDDSKFIIDFYYGKTNYTATMIHTSDIWESDELQNVFDDILISVWDNRYDEEFSTTDNKPYCTYVMDQLAIYISNDNDLRVKFYGTVTQKPPIILSDNVNHPKHYERDGAMECIEEMEVLFGPEAVQTFCKLNAWKYRYRANDKGGKEDYEKSDWYIRKCKELNRRIRLMN